MAITINVSRPKLVGTTTVSPDLIAKPLVEGATYFEIPICYDNLTTTPVALSDISITTGSAIVTGLAEEIANVKVGSVLVTAATTTDFASGTYVISKTTTSLTVSTNALTTTANTTGTATLTVDATAAILRITPVGSDTNSTVRLNLSAAIMNGTNVADGDGNGYDDVAFASGVTNTVGSVSLDFDAFATNFGLARVN